MNKDEIIPERDYFETAVSLEALFKVLPNVKKFSYFLPDNYLNITTSKTAEELLKIPHFLSLDKFVISQIPDIFDNYSFYGHIKENKKTKIDINFSDQISDEYKIQLQTIVDEINETQNRVYKVPRIYFSRITDSSNEKLHALYCQK
uniref:RNA polymerase alpha subunit n=1 Tax=Panagrolaimus davidi TaxID=227884 RepID=A0A914PA11_9BILA